MDTFHYVELFRKYNTRFFVNILE